MLFDIASELFRASAGRCRNDAFPFDWSMEAREGRFALNGDTTMHVLEAALISNTTNAQASRSRAFARTPLRPIRLLRRALAGFVLMGLAVALLDAAAPAESLTLVATTRAPVR